MYFRQLGAILNCTADPEAEIRAKAEQVNAALLDLVQSTTPFFELVSCSLQNH
jgi:hypothetical protein